MDQRFTSSDALRLANLIDRHLGTDPKDAKRNDCLLACLHRYQSRRRWAFALLSFPGYSETEGSNYCNTFLVSSGRQ